MIENSKTIWKRSFHKFSLKIVVVRIQMKKRTVITDKEKDFSNGKMMKKKSLSIC